MPKVFRYRGYLIYFWSNETQANGLLEPVHFHVAKKPNQNAPKFWITSYGAVISTSNKKLDIPKTILCDIIDMVEANPGLVIEEWLHRFSSIRFIDQQR